MSYDEIVQATGYTLEDVKVTLFRARKQIQRLLTQFHVLPLSQA
jgi:DNA-directed RNA polymerase specialized sigma24 family protein